MAVEDLLLIVLAAGLVLFGGLFAVMREKKPESPKGMHYAERTA